MQKRPVCQEFSKLGHSEQSKPASGRAQLGPCCPCGSGFSHAIPQKALLRPGCSLLGVYCLGSAAVCDLYQQAALYGSVLCSKWLQQCGMVCVFWYL